MKSWRTGWRTRRIRIPRPEFGPEAFLPFALASLVVGIAAGLAFPLADPALLRPPAAALLLIWLLALARRRAVLSLAAGAAALCLAGFWLMCGRLCRPPGLDGLDRMAGRQGRLEGVVRGMPLPFSGGLSLEVAVDAAQLDDAAAPAAGLIRVRVYGAGPGDFLPGDEVRGELVLDRPRGRRFPGDRDRRPALADEGIFFTAAVTKGPRLILHRRATPRRWMPVLFFAARTSRLLSTLGQPADGLLHALLLGRTDRLEESVETSFRLSGLAHILSVSGLHVGIFGLMAYGAGLFVLRRLPAVAARMDARRPAALLALPPMAFYTLVTGAQTPAVRSLIMAAVFFLAAAMDRMARPSNGLCLAALVILVASPASLASPSFQLSFLAAWAIIRLAESRPGLLAVKWEFSWRCLARAAAGYLAVSAAAFLATAPLAAAHFSLTAPMGLAANLAAVPLFSYVILPSGLAGGLLALGSQGAASLFVKPAAWGSVLLCRLAEAFSSREWFFTRDFRPSPAQVLALYLALAALLLWRGRARLLGAGLGAGIYIAAGLLGARLEGRGTLKATFLDVGQGDACLVELPGGEAFLVDAGGRFGDIDRGESTVLPCLRAKGIRRLEALIVSHLHPDHAGGVPAVLREMPVGRVFCPAGSLESLGEICRREGVEAPLAAAGEGDLLPVAEAGLAFWAPPREPAGSVADPARGDENSRSLVFSCRAGGGTLVFTGDTGRSTLDRAAGSLRRWTESVVLKVPHHGSPASRTQAFYDAVKPRVAVVPAGRNTFGHPDARVVGALARGGAAVFVTGRDGSVACSPAEGGAWRAFVWRGEERGFSPLGFVHWLMVGY